jgi:hypothetical protein
VQDDVQVSVSTLRMIDTIAEHCAESVDVMTAWTAKLAALVDSRTGPADGAALRVNRARLLPRRDAVVDAMARHHRVPAIAMHGLQFLASLMDSAPTLSSWRSYVGPVVSAMRAHGGAVAAGGLSGAAMLAMQESELWRQCYSRVDAAEVGMALCRVAEEAPATSDIRSTLRPLLERVVRIAVSLCVSPILVGLREEGDVDQPEMMHCACVFACWCSCCRCPPWSQRRRPSVHSSLA